MVLYISGCADGSQAQDLKYTQGDFVTKRGGAVTFAFLDCLKEHGDKVPITKFLKSIAEKVKPHKQVPHLCCTHKIDVSKPFEYCIDGDASNNHRRLGGC